jgi:disulfide bond formation protein DsbB
MLSRTLLNRIIILGYMVLVGFSLAKSIQSGSKLGFLLALLSLGAGIYFLYLLVKANEEMNNERT